MNIRHETPRRPPESQRPPHGNGWSRSRSDAFCGATVWAMWAVVTGDRVLRCTVVVKDIDIALAGRRHAAMRLAADRREWREAIALANANDKDHAAQ